MYQTRYTKVNRNTVDMLEGCFQASCHRGLDLDLVDSG